MTDELIEVLESQPLTPADEYYFEQAYKEPVERIGRIEDVAKFLAGATATTSGLYLAAYKIAFNNATNAGFIWLLPYLLWAVSLILFVRVLVPNRIPTKENSPGSWREAFLKCGKLKYWQLQFGAGFFIAGILAAACPFF